jgi:hypothetical protein
MRASDVTFRNIVPELDNVPVEQRKEIEIIEIKYPDGKVAAFPADAENPESGQKYSNLYARKYQAFKSGDNSERVKELEREIAARQAELDGMKKAPDDKRVQENLGYGKIKPDENGTEQPKGIDQPVMLGSQSKPELDPVLVQPVEPKTKEPA